MLNAHDPALATPSAAEPSRSTLDLSQIPEKLHFNPAEALIWLEDRRMIMMSMEGIGSLRQELIESFGMEAARSLLTRFGYISGCRDAELALKLYKDKASTLDLLMAGGELHALQGIVFGELLRSEIDVEKGI